LKVQKLKNGLLHDGISVQTLETLKVSEGQEWMPQTNKLENAIKFNYFIGNELINIKYRDARKNFKLFKGAEKNIL
jgi:twinkle protein